MVLFLIILDVYKAIHTCFLRGRFRQFATVFGFQVIQYLLSTLLPGYILSQYRWVSSYRYNLRYFFQDQFTIAKPNPIINDRLLWWIYYFLDFCVRKPNVIKVRRDSSFLVLYPGQHRRGDICRHPGTLALKVDVKKTPSLLSSTMP